jgi:hypothetical protein
MRQRGCPGSEISGEVCSETVKKTDHDGFWGICAVCDQKVPVFKNEFGEWASMQHESKIQ